MYYHTNKLYFNTNTHCRYVFKYMMYSLTFILIHDCYASIVPVLDRTLAVTPLPRLFSLLRETIRAPKAGYSGCFRQAFQGSRRWWRLGSVSATGTPQLRKITRWTSAYIGRSAPARSQQFDCCVVFQKRLFFYVSSGNEIEQVEKGAQQRHRRAQDL